MLAYYAQTDRFGTGVLVGVIVTLLVIAAGVAVYYALKEKVKADRAVKAAKADARE